MYTKCNDVFKLTIPAVRAAVAKSLSKDYEMEQAEIAGKLGITQAAVSKYLNGKYSKDVRALEKIARQKGFARKVKLVAMESHKRKINWIVDKLSSEENLIKAAMKLR